ncbi:MAG: HIT family protein [Candidatus Micrarchaeia archaeon]
MEECIFCKIAARQIPADVVYEDEKYIAFLDINPAAKGHSLVVPKKHTSDIHDMEEPELSLFAGVVQRVARAIKEVTKCDGINIVMNNGRTAGQIIFHAHCHVVPRFHADGISFRVPRARYAEGEAAEVARKVLEATKQ